VIDLDRLALPPGYRMEHVATTVWALRAPDGRIVQRFSRYDSDNDHVWFYVQANEQRRSDRES
jgi:hypothetical protein